MVVDEPEKKQVEKEVKGSDSDEDDGEVLDLEEELEKEDDTDNVFASGKFVSKDGDADSDEEMKDASEGQIIGEKAKWRKYDLSITYDFYH